MGSGENLAGLFTVDLPASVSAGQEFNIVVRRMGRHGTLEQRTPTQVNPNVIDGKLAPNASASKRLSQWRYVIGTFQVKIPVTTSEVMLFPEENTLAIMKWRLQQMVPANRWYPVLKRYIEYVSDRISGLGGDPTAIPASPNGAPIKSSRPCEDLVEIRGKVAQVVFDCFGDLEGFVLDDCCDLHAFKTRERELGELAIRACTERLTISVFAEQSDRSKVHRFVIRP